MVIKIDCMQVRIGNNNGCEGIRIRSRFNCNLCNHCNTQKYDILLEYNECTVGVAILINSYT